MSDEQPSNKKFYVIATLVLAVILGVAYVFTSGGDAETPTAAPPSEGIHL